MIFIDDQVALCKVAGRYPFEGLLHDYQRHEPTGMLDRELVLEMGRHGLISADLPQRQGEWRAP